MLALEAIGAVDEKRQAFPRLSLIFHDRHTDNRRFRLVRSH
jgi:hypothetical protein